ncbi:MAG: NADH-quinone oxidoreductase subunit NuoH [Bacteriovoracales bacterium]|nr:NADH-quinone oxidoreductase subunit NuoH [Bacteriovoracales bacterium]
MNGGLIPYLSGFDWFNQTIKSTSAFLSFDTTSLLSFLIYAVFASLLVFLVLMPIGGLGTYAERKISADLQARIGPNRVGPYGILQFLADGIKMVLKEDIVPVGADRFVFYLAPLLAMVGVFMTVAVLPLSSGLTMVHLDIGVFYLLAVSSLVGIAVFLGGYAPNSKWSLLGGMRGASQIISYEIPVVISVLAIVLLSGGMSFDVLVGSQGGLPHRWFLFHNPFTFLAFFVYFVGALAEANRAPFDLPEAESELVSGYHTEYTGMRFAFFALAEYVEVFVLCAVAAALFLGGYNVPGELLKDHPLGQLLQLGAFFTKTLILYYVVIWVRWTLPRIRVDQLMTICWKYLTPIALFNLVGCALWMYCFDGKSIVSLLFESGVGAASGGH